MLNLLFFVLIYLALIALVVYVASIPLRRRKKREAARENKCTAEVNAEPDPLTLCSKEQYDFLRDNGLKVTQDVHDHFYPPYHTNHGGWGDGSVYRQPLDRWGDRTIDWEAHFKEKERRALAEEHNRAVEQHRKALTVSKIKAGGDQYGISYDDLQDAVRIYKQATEWKPWIDTERIRG